MKLLTIRLNSASPFRENGCEVTLGFGKREDYNATARDNEPGLARL